MHGHLHAAPCGLVYEAVHTENKNLRGMNKTLTVRSYTVAVVVRIRRLELTESQAWSPAE